MSPIFYRFWYIWIHYSYPFDWKTPVGYLISSCIQTATAFHSVAMFICTLSFTVGYCLFAFDFVFDIDESLRMLNYYLVAAKDRELSKEEKLNVKHRLIGIMTFHSDAKELSDTGFYWFFVVIYDKFLFTSIQTYNPILAHQQRHHICVSSFYVDVILLFIPAN